MTSPGNNETNSTCSPFFFLSFQSAHSYLSPMILLFQYGSVQFFSSAQSFSSNTFKLAFSEVSKIASIDEVYIILFTPCFIDPSNIALLLFKAGLMQSISSSGGAKGNGEAICKIYVHP